MQYLQSNNTNLLPQVAQFHHFGQVLRRWLWIPTTNTRTSNV